ncbi:hypothetical protein CJD36_006255 [Flavipsychrobacter stenotrophus]|uniref:DUF6089 domain-containing protein n=2 Tax=Flavipsychrobacter stenotrophus TaxID=2077091 RepID=A0A2S7SXQ0_9BACT|nr:hypothetical protein CJD36_006255 [Flavipsychrobacter stenotrophus]
MLNFGLAIMFIIPKFVSIFRMPLLKLIMLKRIILSLFLLLPFCVNAQQSHHEIGITLGLSNYYGDLQPKMFPSIGYHPMGGIIYKYFMNPHFGLRFGANYTSLSASDSDSNIPVNRARNLSFGTHLFEMHGALEVNFLPIEINDFKVTPYVFGGLSAFYYNPFADDPNGNRVFLRPLSTEGQGLPIYPDRKQYSQINMAFPFGGGAKFFIGKTLMLTTELGFRYTNTDYLDDVSKSYVDLDSLNAYKGMLAKTMAYRGNTLATWDKNNPYYGFQRGDSKANDWYWYANISVAIYFRAFGNTREYLKTRCPGFFR